MCRLLCGLLLASFSCSVCADSPAPAAGLVLDEIARGHSWVSPYWGYSSPKIVWDGTAYYTAGLWGEVDEAEGRLYQFRDGAWQEGVLLPDIYQPATLAIDADGRVLVAYCQQDRSLCLLRAAVPGSVTEFEILPSPPDRPACYYIGIAVRGQYGYLASIDGSSNSMYLSRLNLVTLRWMPSLLMQAGQIKTIPKTAWTYPILVPDAAGLHGIASNSPDGGTGNTYNRIVYTYYPDAAWTQVPREVVAESPLGHNALAMDLAVEEDGGVHVLYMWNQRIYGDPLPETSPAAGTYHAWRNPATDAWQRYRLGAIGIAGFYQEDGALFAVLQEQGALVLRQWQPEIQEWTASQTLLSAVQLPVPVSFMDVLKPPDGGRSTPGLALVGDGMLPQHGKQPQQRLLWSLLPAP